VPAPLVARMNEALAEGITPVLIWKLPVMLKVGKLAMTCFQLPKVKLKFKALIVLVELGAVILPKLPAVPACNSKVPLGTEIPSLIVILFEAAAAVRVTLLVVPVAEISLAPLLVTAILPVLVIVTLPPVWLMPVMVNAPVLVKAMFPLVVLVALNPVTVFAPLNVCPVPELVVNKGDVLTLPASVIVVPAFSVTLPDEEVKVLATDSAPEATNLIFPLLVVRLAAVVKLPPLLSKSMLPVPTESAVAGKVKVPDDLIVKGLFVARVGVKVKLPVFEMNAPPEPEVKVIVPVVVVNKDWLLVPIVPADAVGTLRVMVPAVTPPVAPA